MSRTKIATALLTTALLAMAGCASAPVSYVSPDVDFGFIRRVAVTPFVNMSSDRYASQRMESVFLAELLTYRGLDVVDPGEMLQAWNDMRLGADVVLTPEQAVGLGERLGVDAVFTGAIEEYGLERLGGDKTYNVTAVFGLVETVTGSQIWSAQVHADGASLWKNLFGGQPVSLYEVSRRAVRRSLDTLLAGGGSSGNDRGDSSR